MTGMFPETVRTWPRELFFEKGAWPGLRDPLRFWALNADISKTVKATYFKFWQACFQLQSGRPLNFFSKRGVARVTWPPKFLVSRADHTHIVHRTATHWTWSARVTKFVISHFLKYFFSMFNDRPFKFYTQLKREEYNIYMHNGP